MIIFFTRTQYLSFVGVGAENTYDKSILEFTYNMTLIVKLAKIIRLLVPRERNNIGHPLQPFTCSQKKKNL